MSGTSRSIVELLIQNLKDPGYCGGKSNGGRYLGDGEQIFPEERSADDPLRNYDDIARIETSRKNL
jgi:hypothetical protein